MGQGVKNVFINFAHIICRVYAYTYAHMTRKEKKTTLKVGSINQLPPKNLIVKRKYK